MPWVLEQAMTQAVCRKCRRPVKKGHWRFGKKGRNGHWFHLDCAAAGAPVMFPPFAKRAKELMGEEQDFNGSFTEADRAMAAKLAGEGLPVLADWLTSRGDPWGELITLRLAGAEQLAIEHFDTHRKSLVGELPIRDVEWQSGVVTSALLMRTGTNLIAPLRALMSHRTASLLERLELRVNAIGPEALKLLSRAPATMVDLSIQSQGASGLEHLDLPELESLELALNSQAMPGLLSSKLPKLRWLALDARKPLTLSFVRDLAASRLFAGLSHFSVGECLTDEGLMVLVDAKPKHLRTTWVELDHRALTAEQRRRANAVFKKSNARLLKVRAPSPDRDPDHDTF